MVEERRDVTGLPVDDTCDPFGVMWIHEDVVIVEVIMPEARAGNCGIIWDNGTDDFLITCQRGEFLLCVRSIKPWAAE